MNAFLPTFDLPRLCRDLLALVNDLASPTLLAQQPRLADALKQFAADARPLLEEATTSGLTAAPARRILQGMTAVARLSGGTVVHFNGSAGFFVLKRQLAEALEHASVPGQRPAREGQRI